MRRLAELLRGLLALATLAALVIGLPAFLVSAVGWPLPRGVPLWSEVRQTLAGDRPLDADVPWKVLAVILWLAWAYLVPAVVVEAVARAQATVPHPLAGFGAAHGVVAPLVAAVALAWPSGAADGAAAGAVLMPPSIAASTPAPETPAMSAPAGRVVTAPPAPALPDEVATHVVGRRDNLWDLSVRYYAPDGDPAAVEAGIRRIVDANVGVRQPDGRTLVAGGRIGAGWVLRIPPPHAGDSGAALDASVPAVVVEPGDNLWDLTDEHLTPSDTNAQIAAGVRAVFEANVGRPQADGEVLSDPDHIEPGWVLQLPAVSEPSSGSAFAPPSTTAPEPEPAPAPAPACPPALGQQPGVSPGRAHASPEALASDGGVAQAPTDAPETTTVDDRDDDEVQQAPVPVGLAGGGLALGGLVLLLERRRRAQHRRRGRGRRRAPLSPPEYETERTLRAGADPQAAIRVDAAMRAAAAADESNGLPFASTVEVGRDDVTGVMERPAQPAQGSTGTGTSGWRSSLRDDSEPRSRWRTTLPVEELSSLGAAACAPAPALAPVGTTEGGVELLVDLEAAGVLAVTGDPETRAGLFRSMAVALATAPWSEEARVLVVGLGDSLPAVPGVEGVADLGEALDVVERRAGEIAAAMSSAQCDAPAAARAQSRRADGWEPVVAISALVPDPAEVSRLTELAHRRGRGAAVVVSAPAGGVPQARTLEVDDGGVVHLAGVDAQVRARQLSDDDVRQVVQLLEATERADVAPADTDDPPVRGPASTADLSSGSHLADLMADVDVLVRVMGEVELARLGPGGEERLAVPRQKSVEAIAYLALREMPVDPENLQADLWPDGSNSPKTFRNVMWAARKALGQASDGTELLPPLSGRYSLSERVVTDYGLFHELVARADETDDPDGVDGLRAEALALVRGEPFVGVGRGYAWVHKHTGLILAEITDAAEALAMTRLATGDWRGAEWAARQGLRAFPCDERLYRVLMRAAYASGNVAGVHRVFQELLVVLADPDRGVEPEDTVHDETVALLEELTRSSRAG